MADKPSERPKPNAALAAFLNNPRAARPVQAGLAQDVPFQQLFQPTPFKRPATLGLPSFARGVANTVLAGREKQQADRDDAFRTAARTQVLLDQQGVAPEDQHKILGKILEPHLSPDENARFGEFFKPSAATLAEDTAAQKARTATSEAATAGAREREAASEFRRGKIEDPEGMAAIDPEAASLQLRATGLEQPDQPRTVQIKNESELRLAGMQLAAAAVTNGDLTPDQAQAMAQGTVAYLSGEADIPPAELNNLRFGHTELVAQLKDIMTTFGYSLDEAMQLLQDPTRDLEFLQFRHEQLIQLAQSGVTVKPTDISDAGGAVKLWFDEKRELAGVRSTLEMSGKMGDAVEDTDEVLAILQRLNIARGTPGLMNSEALERLEKFVSSRLTEAQLLHTTLNNLFNEQQNLVKKFRGTQEEFFNDTGRGRRGRSPGPAPMTLDDLEAELAGEGGQNNQGNQ